MYNGVIELWNGQQINLIVENRYVDTGEILLSVSDDIESGTASMRFSELIQLRDKISQVIQLCEATK